MSKDNQDNITKKMLLGDIAAVSSSSVKVKELYRARGVERIEYRDALEGFLLLDAFDEALNHARIEKMRKARNVQREKEGKEKIMRKLVSPETSLPLPGPTTLPEAAKEKGPVMEKPKPASPKEKESPKPKEEKGTKETEGKLLFGMDNKTLVWVALLVGGGLLLYLKYKDSQPGGQGKGKTPISNEPDALTPEGREAILKKRWEGQL